MLKGKRSSMSYLEYSLQATNWATSLASYKLTIPLASFDIKYRAEYKALGCRLHISKILSGMSIACKKRLKNEKLLVCAILVQLALGCAFTLFVEYGNESNGAYVGNSYHGVHLGVQEKKSGKNSLPNSYYMAMKIQKIQQELEVCPFYQYYTCPNVWLPFGCRSRHGPMNNWFNIGSLLVFQDVHLMMFIGFGYLLMLMKNSDRRSITLYFLVVAISLQWGTLCYGFFRTVKGKIYLDIDSLLNADFACAGVLISCAAVSEFVTPLQLMFMALLEIAFSSTNKWVGSVVFQASDVGSSMFIHAFGAYFGLAVSFVLYRRTAYCVNRQSSRKNEANDPIRSTFSASIVCKQTNHKNRNDVLVDLVAQFQRLPCKRGCGTVPCHHQHILFIIGQLRDGLRRFVSRCQLLHDVFQNSTLVGGVVIGTSADMMVNIWGAMIIGGLAGAGSVFIDRFSAKHIVDRVSGIRDAWRVNTLHGMPGILAGLVGAVVSAAATKEDYGFRFLYRQFPARSPLNSSSEFLRIEYYNLRIDPGIERTASQQAGYQIAALVVTLAIAIVGGLGTGMVLLLPFFRQPVPSEENDSQSDLSHAVDQLLLSDRNATVENVVTTEPVTTITENPSSVC
ncbi:Uncharacterized protein APZ42_034406 [Daphnia magna]|uniref:Ammonium transporter AmtB-like domain-containing protein n=1 Tax=Daphnia magna TaxID=35525 RepID=A0A164K6I9_9CRUS|nr:Uncharacterized protein APZ42_034406 [Daphnia magna]